VFVKLTYGIVLDLRLNGITDRVDFCYGGYTTCYALTKHQQVHNAATAIAVYYGQANAM